MPQDSISGGRAATWGRETARAIGLHLGATDQKANSNECRLNGEAVTIKCAAPNTLYVGVTYQNLERLDAVIGAFQRNDGAFDLWSVTPAQFKALMRDSSGKNHGRVGLVSRADFERRGQRVGQVVL